MPSASTKVRWNGRAAMPRWMYCRDLSSSWRPRMTSWLSSTVTSSWSRVNHATARVMRRCSGLFLMFGTCPCARNRHNIIGRISVRGFADTIKHTLDLIEAKQEGTRKRRNPGHGYKVLVKRLCGALRSEEHTSELQSPLNLV